MPLSLRSRVSTSLAALTLLASLSGEALAQRTLIVAGYGGSFERLMREQVIPSFERANDARVQYVAGQSTATLARLQAQRNNQEIDVAIVDDGPMYQAVQFGLCAPIEASGPLNDLHQVARLSDRAVAFSVGATGIVYNERTFTERGWPAPTSWNDLGAPHARGQLSLLGAGSTTGLHGLIMVARANGGGEANINPGFEAFTQRIRPNVVTFAPAAPKLEELLQSGEIAITVVAQARAVALRRAGLPVRFVAPREGAGALMTATCPVVNSDVPELAQAFVRHLLSPEVQRLLGLNGYGPVNRTVRLTPEEAESFPYGEEAMSRLSTLDWPTINANRAAWTQRWNREVER